MKDKVTSHDKIQHSFMIKKKNFQQSRNKRKLPQNNKRGGAWVAQ